jgi:hypothetical protein
VLELDIAVAPCLEYCLTHVSNVFPSVWIGALGTEAVVRRVIFKRQPAPCETAPLFCLFAVRPYILQLLSTVLNFGARQIGGCL